MADCSLFQRDSADYLRKAKLTWLKINKKIDIKKKSRQSSDLAILKPDSYKEKNCKLTHKFNIDVLKTKLNLWIHTDKHFKFLPNCMSA